MRDSSVIALTVDIAFRRFIDVRDDAGDATGSTAQEACECCEKREKQLLCQVFFRRSRNSS